MGSRKIFFIYFYILQWLCNIWNIGYILVPLLRNSLKEISVFDHIESQRKSGQGCESGADFSPAGSKIEFKQLLLLISPKTPCPWNFQQSLLENNPQTHPGQVFFLIGLIPRFHRVWPPPIPSGLLRRKSLCLTDEY